MSSVLSCYMSELLFKLIVSTQTYKNTILSFVLFSPLLICLCTFPLGMKKRSSESNVEVEIHDGDDGGLVMEVHKHRGRV